MRIMVIIFFLLMIAGVDGAVAQETSDDCAPRIAFASPEDGDMEIYTMRIDGTDLQQLTINDEDYDDFPTWSPDGTQIAYTHGFRLFIMDADGSHSEEVPIDHSVRYPAWSPDGHYIVFEDNTRIVIVDLTTFETNIISETELRGQYNSSPAWSPDGTRIVYTSSGDREPQLALFLPRLDFYIVNIDGSNRTRVPIGDFGSVGVGNLNWLSDERIIYSSGDLYSSVSMIDLTDNSIIQLTDYLTSIFYGPVVAPNEQQMLIFDRGQLGITDLTVSEIQVIENAPERIFHPAWQPQNDDSAC
ncbi:MAG: hypothetical protein RLP44_08265 [Aggregatilineales bacterium]